MSWIVPDGVLDDEPPSRRIVVPLANASSSPIGGVAELREAVPGSPIIAATCVSVPAGSEASVALDLDREALTELEVRSHYTVRLELIVSEAGGRRALISSPYLLRDHP
jgi:hypothetical protein